MNDKSNVVGRLLREEAAEKDIEIARQQKAAEIWKRKKEERDELWIKALTERGAALTEVARLREELERAAQRFELLALGFSGVSAETGAKEARAALTRPAPATSEEINPGAPQ